VGSKAERLPRVGKVSKVSGCSLSSNLVFVVGFRGTVDRLVPSDVVPVTYSRSIRQLYTRYRKSQLDGWWEVFEVEHTLK
jgi:hypothetical protein